MCGGGVVYDVVVVVMVRGCRMMIVCGCCLLYGVVVVQCMVCGVLCWCCGML